MKTSVFYVDFAAVTSKEDMFRKLHETLPIPVPYGDNLDALHDVLSEYGGGWDIILYNTTGAQQAVGPYFQRFRRLCEDLSGERADLRIRIYP